MFAVSNPIEVDEFFQDVKILGQNLLEGLQVLDLESKNFQVSLKDLGLKDTRRSLGEI